MMLSDFIEDCQHLHVVVHLLSWNLLHIPLPQRRCIKISIGVTKRQDKKTLPQTYRSHLVMSSPSFAKSFIMSSTNWARELAQIQWAGNWELRGRRRKATYWVEKEQFRFHVLQILNCFIWLLHISHYLGSVDNRFEPMTREGRVFIMSILKCRFQNY